jgi:hypothetical protein
MDGASAALLGDINEQITSKIGVTCWGWPKVIGFIRITNMEGGSIYIRVDRHSL